MRRIVLMAILGFGCGALVLTGLVVVAMGGRSSGDSPDIHFAIGGERFVVRREFQPNGAFVLQICEEQSGMALITGTVSCNPVMRWFVVEDAGDVWLYSSDVGIYVFKRIKDSQGSGVWSEVAWERNEAAPVMLPRALYDQMPESMQRTLTRFRRAH